MFRSLNERGLDSSEVVCVTCDDHLRLRDALQRYFPHAAWQRCQVHYQNEVSAKVFAVIVHWKDRVLTFAEWLTGHRYLAMFESEPAEEHTEDVMLQPVA